MSKLNCYAIGTIRISEENMLALYATCYRQVLMGIMDNYLHCTDTTEQDVKEFELKLENEDEFHFVVSFLNYYGNVLSFYANIYEIETDNYDVKYKFIDGNFYRSFADVENVYEELGEYATFKEIIMKKKEMSYFNSPVKGLTFKHLLDSIKVSKTEEEFLTNAQITLGKNIDFNEPKFEIKMGIGRDDLECDDNTQLAIFNDEEGVLSYFIDSICKEFNDYNIYEFKASDYIAYDEMQTDIKVTVKFKINDIDKIVTIPISAARNLFWTDKSKLLHQDKWVDPCSICDKRLRKEMSGCNICDFNSI